MLEKKEKILIKVQDKYKKLSRRPFFREVINLIITL